MDFVSSTPVDSDKHNEDAVKDYEGNRKGDEPEGLESDGNESDAVGPEAGPTDIEVNTGHTDNLTVYESEADLSYVGEPKEVDVEYVYPTHVDPMRSRSTSGIYLDDLQRANAEARRAELENREPDFENAPAVCGTPLIQKHVQIAAMGGLVNGDTVKTDVTLPVVVGLSEEDAARV